MIYHWCNILSYICILCFMVRNANDSIISPKCCTGISVVRKIPSQMLLDDPKLLLDLKSYHDCLDVINFVQLHFRQKGSDKNHTSLGSYRISMICGFVFTSDQICSQDYLATGSMAGTHFSHGFGVYSHVFGVYPSVQWFPKHYKCSNTMEYRHCMIALWNAMIQSY